MILEGPLPERTRLRVVRARVLPLPPKRGPRCPLCRSTDGCAALSVPTTQPHRPRWLRVCRSQGSVLVLQGRDEQRSCDRALAARRRASHLATRALATKRKRIAPPSRARPETNNRAELVRAMPVAFCLRHAPFTGLPGQSRRRASATSVRCATPHGERGSEVHARYCERIVC